MILVDTSVWIDHFRRRGASLVHLLDAGLVLCHPFVIGELACGHLGPPLEPVRQDLGRAPGVLHLLPITQPPVELDPRLDQLPLLPLHVGLRGPDRALGGLLLHGDRRLVRAEVAAVPAHLARP